MYIRKMGMDEKGKGEEEENVSTVLGQSGLWRTGKVRLLFVDEKLKIRAEVWVSRAKHKERPTRLMSQTT